MRIAIFTDTYLPDINGVVTSIEMEREKLEELGHEVYIVCTYPGALKIRKEGRIIRLPGIEIKKLYGYAIASPLHFTLIDELRSLDFDIIHAETEFGVGLFANICSRHLDLPLVRTYHTTYEDYTHYLNFLKSRTVETGLRKAVVLLSKTYAENCMRMISPSEKTRDMLVGYGVKNRIDIIPTGIDIERFEKCDDSETIEMVRRECGVEDDEKLLLYVGRLAEEKSIDLVISAMKKAVDKGLKLRFAIVGDGPELPELKKLVDELSLSDKVIFLGKKGFEEVPRYYHSADAFVSASTSETQGMTYIEALSSGLPVFARYDKVLDDIVTDGRNGRFFRNEEELLGVLEDFVAMNREEYSGMCDEAKKSTAACDSRLFGLKLEKLFTEVIEDYGNSLWISRTSLKDDYVTLTLKSATDEKFTVSLSLDDYYSHGFRSDSKVSLSLYESLKEKERLLKAYRSCLRKIAAKDRTVRQIKDHLRNSFDLRPEEIEAMISRLMDKKLLDDRVYAMSRIAYLNMASLSRRMMVRKLKDDGVSDEIIEETLKTDVESERYKAIRKAEKYKNLSRNKSLSAKKQMIVSKLISEGFSSENARAAIEALDFSDDVLQENDLLRKEAYKAYKKYERRFKDSELRNHVFRSLVSKGFSYEEIYCVINEMEW